MNPEYWRSEDARPLKVRTRSTLAGNGETTAEQTVFCPRQDKAVGVEECHDCCHYEGYDSGRTYLYCNTPEAQRAHGNDGFLPGRLPTEADRTRVSAIMTSDVVCVRPDLSIEALGALLLERGISGVPVVDDQGYPIGMVSKTDLVREAIEGGDVEESVRLTKCGQLYELERGYHAEALPLATVEDVMMQMAFTLSEDTSISQAAALMAFEGVHRVPVVSAEGKVVGIVSSLDVLAWLAGHDGYLVRNTLQRPVNRGL